ncbi:MAG: Na-translocating system protein MpsC family protein [Planctomycetota bacterium]
MTISPPLPVLEQLATVARNLQQERTGYPPKAVTVVIGDDMLVITLHDALSPAERLMSETAAGAADLQEFHRQLFAGSSTQLRDEIKRITGRAVREAAVEVEPVTGTVVHAFTSGNVVQIFQLIPGDQAPFSGTTARA